ncbi:plus-3-domain-containing protein [Pluteus cervinus]|uniref:Plus-3-domain-containing protein n=1 Tax=Pluteus cervinus TaxID=181527 RepID=A0ACD3AZE1_9AGAR|nr:plus-3-domain-containing protein [Pluteus cervinus]
MSESDIDDMLLELAGEGQSERKRKRRSPSGGNGGNAGNAGSSSSKRRRAEASKDSDDDPDSSYVDPFPLEGKYTDEEDRQRLLQLSEIEREEIITQRLEEKQKLQDRRAVLQMVREQKGGVETSDSVSKAAKRQHTQRGSTKEKTRTLDELKAKRKAKGEKQRSKNHSPRRDRSSSPTDMEISDGESEDGQITKDEQEEERERRLLKQASLPEEEPATLADLEKCRLSRDLLAKFCWTAWFDQYAQNAWVRYLIGQENGQPVYRICEVASLITENIKPYKLNDKSINQAFDLKHGKSTRSFLMDKVSNSAFNPKEFDRLVKVCQAEDVKMPSKQTLEKKAAQMQKFVSQPLTEGDIDHILKRKKIMDGLTKKPTGLPPMERSRLITERTLAIRRQDHAEVKALETILAEHDISFDGPSTTDSRQGTPGREKEVDLMAKVNERNRKANMEAVRRAELAEAERKRRERKLAAAGVVSDTIDPSARLKTLPRLFNAATPASRPGTPAAKGTMTPTSNVNGAVASSAVTAGIATPKATPMKKVGGASWEKSFIDSVEVDLGDF